MYAIRSYYVSEKMFGVFPHRIVSPNEKLLRGFDDEFYAPHARHTEIRQKDIESIPDLDILSLSVITSYSIHYTKLYESR